MTTPVLTPKELAHAIGVSESSLKRWADEGVVQCSRTAGGHRRIPLPEAIRFIRETRATLVRPEILGIPEISKVVQNLPADADAADHLFEHLLAGRAVEARGLLLAGYVRGRTIADLGDRVIAPAMSRLGELWQHQGDGIFLEHRATDIIIRAVGQLRVLLSDSQMGPPAVGGAPAGDPYMLPTMLAAAVLDSEGFGAVNLGPNTPAQSLVQAAEHYDARLAWLSISVSEGPDGVDQFVQDLVAGLSALRPVPRLVIGGRERTAAKTSAAVVSVGSLQDLATFARGLLPDQNARTT